MARLIEVPLAGGGSITVEADDLPGGGAITRGGRAQETIARAGETFEEALARVAPAFKVLLAELRQAAEQPDSVEIEFGLKLTAEMGAIIARSGGEANFRVAVRWARE